MRSARCEAARRKGRESRQVELRAVEEFWTSELSNKETGCQRYCVTPEGHSVFARWFSFSGPTYLSSSAAAPMYTSKPPYRP